jgi:protoheme IX farnesyltransferase
MNVANPAITPALAGDLLLLTKPRITLMVAFTSLVGYFLAAGRPLDVVGLLAAVTGTALVAAGASALNMVLERDTDARMRRTETRPLPAGRLPVTSAVLFASVLSAAGVLLLLTCSGWLATLVAILTWVSYLFLYTPLKRRTSLATLVGAIPGALPPVIGWTAAHGDLRLGAFLLFALVFLWQVPHFLAIGWLYREDYAQAGFPMLPVIDRQGFLTATQALAYAVALLGMSVAPTLAGIAGRSYLMGVLLLGVVLCAACLWFAAQRTTRSARLVFLVSLVYLPVASSLLLWDRT